MTDFKIAFLGPKGSYSEQALSLFAPSAEHIECESVAEAFQLLVAEKVDRAFVPYENIIQGPVTETLDLLLRYRGQVFLQSSVLHKINHALGCLPGVNLAQITEVCSHYQALQQCSRFLDSTLPHSARVPTSSTSGAIELVAAKQMKQTAVIAAPEALKQHGLEILREHISNTTDNQTRFVIVKRGQALLEQHDPSTKSALGRFVTSLALHPGRDRKGMLHEVLTIASIKHQVNLISIHSRPDAKGGFVFFLEIEGHLAEPAISACIKDLENYCLHSTGSTAEVIIFGSYTQTAFSEMPFQKIGIIGGKGEMGRWFKTFFGEANLEVEEFDLDSSFPLAPWLKSMDIVILSVPMNQLPKVVNEIAPHLRKGQLVVENCSIKSCSLPVMDKLLPEGVEILGMHTLFGGKTPSLKDQNIIFTHTRSGPLAQSLEDLFYKYGARIHHASLNEHDKYTSITQSLSHLLLISLASLLRRECDNISAIEPYSTPNFRELLSAMGRILGQSDTLILDLQTLNDSYPAIRQRYLAILFELCFALEHNNLDQIVRATNNARSFFTHHSKD